MSRAFAVDVERELLRERMQASLHLDRRRVVDARVEI